MLRHLDRQQHAGHDVDVRPAVFLRDVDAEQAHRLGLLDQPLMVGRIEFRRVGIELRLERDDLLAHEAAHLVDQHLLFGAGFEIHLPLLSPNPSPFLVPLPR